MVHEEERKRIVIEGVDPEIDEGQFPVKRVVGDRVVVEADIYADGHDVLSAVLLHRKEGGRDWTEVPMEFLVNDRWRGSFIVDELGQYQYTFIAWVDRFKTWQQNLKKKAEAKQDTPVDFMEGIRIIEETIQRATRNDAKTMQEWIEALSINQKTRSNKIRLALSNKLTTVMTKYSDRRSAVAYSRELEVVVDRKKARFSTWYEMFPRSCANKPGQHGTFKDCERRLPYISEMGFDVLYFPPIHPIGYTSRKGKNNITTAKPNDPGTPWAIGSPEGGHKTVHSQLGTLEDFRNFIEKAREYDIEVALDIAFQCSPDHPYVREHPEGHLSSGV